MEQNYATVTLRIGYSSLPQRTKLPICGAQIEKNDELNAGFVNEVVGGKREWKLAYVWSREWVRENGNHDDSRTPLVCDGYLLATCKSLVVFASRYTRQCVGVLHEV